MFNENDIKVVKGGGSTVVFNTAANQAIKPGEPCKISGANVIIFADSDPEAGTDIMVGIAHKTSTDTASVAGKVEITTMIPMQTVLRWNVTTPANINTQAKIDAMVNYWKSADYEIAATGAFTLDDAEDDPDTHGFGVIGGDPIGLTLDTYVSMRVTWASPTA